MMIRNTPGSLETNRHSNAISDVICDLPNSLQNKSRYIGSRAQAFSGCLAVDRGANGLHANHSIFERAEATHTGLIQSDRNRGGIVPNGGRTTRASAAKL